MLDTFLIYSMASVWSRTILWRCSLSLGTTIHFILCPTTVELSRNFINRDTVLSIRRGQYWLQHQIGANNDNYASWSGNSNDWYFLSCCDQVSVDSVGNTVRQSSVSFDYWRMGLTPYGISVMARNSNQQFLQHLTL